MKSSHPKLPARIAITLAVLGVAIAWIYYGSLHKNQSEDRANQTPEVPQNESREDIIRLLGKRLKDASSPDAVLAAFRAANQSAPINTIEAGGLLHDVANTWYKQNPVWAVEMIASLPNETDRMSAILWGAPWYSENPKAFLDEKLTGLIPENAANIRRAVFRAVADSNPKLGIELIENQGQGEDKNRSIGSFFVRLASRNPEEAVLLAKELEFAEDRELAFQAIVDGVDSKNSVELLQRIPQEHQQNAAIAMANRCLEGSSFSELVAVIESLPSDPFRDTLAADLVNRLEAKGRTQEAEKISNILRKKP
jgi:hypothetical protein